MRDYLGAYVLELGGIDVISFTGGIGEHSSTVRGQVLRDLESRGVLSLDVFPEDMTAPLINRYLDIKARHLL